MHLAPMINATPTFILVPPTCLKTTIICAPAHAITHRAFATRAAEP